jgi:hypothetical protein
LTRYGRDTKPPRGLGDAGEAGTDAGCRILVLSCRDSRTDFRVPLATAFRQSGYETCYLNISERSRKLADNVEKAGKLSFAIVEAWHFTRTDKVNLIIDSTNLTHPFLVAILRIVVRRAIWCFDMHDDLLYDARGIRRFYARVRLLVRARTSDIIFVAAAGLRELFPQAVHVGNASHMVPKRRRELDCGRVLVMASIDVRFDLDLLSAAASDCIGTVFDVYGRFRLTDMAVRRRFEDLIQRRRNIRYHGSYDTSDIEGLVTRYDVMFAPYRMGIRLTRYLDPLRIYHCLNAGMEVIVTDIPVAAEDFSRAVHIVRNGNDVSETLDRLQAGAEARRNTRERYSPITWVDRARQIVGAVERLPKFRRLADEGGDQYP